MKNDKTFFIHHFFIEKIVLRAITEDQSKW